jgi:hypothetical protein
MLIWFPQYAHIGLLKSINIILCSVLANKIVSALAPKPYLAVAANFCIKFFNKDLMKKYK